TTVSSNAIVSIQTAALVGHWLTNNTLADTSGFRPAGTHDGYDINNTGNFAFTNDVPPSKSGKSLLLFNGDTGIAISNSSLADANYTNTFDTTIHSSFTVGCFAKGWPGTWNPWVSKYGEAGLGWQLRQYGFNGISPAWTIRGTGDADDMAATTLNLAGDTNNWHFYVGTYNAATHVRNLYVDGTLSATETNNGPYAMSPYSHLAIGARDNGTNTFGNYFTGEIYDVRVYNYALSSSEILNWYGAVAPSIAGQPVSTAAFVGSKATFTVTASGTPPLTYQWQLNGTNVNLLPDAANFTGATSNVLTIQSVSANDVGSYHLIVTSSLGYGTVTSSNAVLSIVPKVLLGEWFTNGTLSELS
ncbi:MAG: immunoglobulin domain-containing protein, partial [Verrucomicrobia bacterium]|nr:immunoglobulin domain-containing protein [Verrucomicrobiota bacterium]